MLSKFNNEEGIAILSSFLQGNAETWFKARYDINTAHTRNTLEMIIGQLEEHFGAAKLSFIDIESMLNRPQRCNEDFDAFFSEMCKREQKCAKYHKESNLMSFLKTSYHNTRGHC